MAQFAVIQLDNGGWESSVNIRKVVGAGGVNLYEDVLLIQALFKYIAEGLGAHALFGTEGEKEYAVPEITGKMDAETYSAIGAFQTNHMPYLLMKTFDGRIHPASYKGRKLTLSTRRRLMAITLLHIFASDASVMRGDGDYTMQLPRMNSDLAGFLDSSLLEM